jgi:hypothetical protein
MPRIHKEENAGHVGPVFQQSMYNSDLYPVHIAPNSQRDSDFEHSDIASEAEAWECDRLASVQESHRREGAGHQFIEDGSDEGESDEDGGTEEENDSDCSMETA